MLNERKLKEISEDIAKYNRNQVIATIMQTHDAHDALIELLRDRLKQLDEEQKNEQ